MKDKKVGLWEREKEDQSPNSGRRRGQSPPSAGVTREGPSKEPKPEGRWGGCVEIWEGCSSTGLAGAKTPKRNPEAWWGWSAAGEVEGSIGTVVLRDLTADRGMAFIGSNKGTERLSRIKTIYWIYYLNDHLNTFSYILPC